ncbi:phosphotransferase enzyme family protein [Paenibacillus tarimensis]
MNEGLLKDIIHSNYSLRNVKITESPQGASNITKFVLDDDQKYVLRIYKHSNKKKVIYEHEVVSKMNSMSLDFSIPDFRLTKTGQSFLQTSDILMAIYPFIPGQPFQRHNISSFGKLISKTISGLKRVTVNSSPQGNPYLELLHISPDYLSSFYDTLNKPPFNFSNADVKVFIESIELQISLISDYEKLPVQLIHGDLTRQNVLFNNERNLATGILDFELASECYKTLEIATPLASMLRMKFPEEEDMFIRIKELITGYKQYERLSSIEIDLLPNLIMLRLLSISLYHIKRFACSTDDNTIIYYFPFMLAWEEWLSKHSETLKNICLSD